MLFTRRFHFFVRVDFFKTNLCPGPKVIKLFMLDTTEHEMYPAHQC